jgi:pimeloyl-ACP methyl ester carboxylesterase
MGGGYLPGIAPPRLPLPEPTLNIRKGNMSNLVTMPGVAYRAEKATVIALHCSGSSHRQWRHLTEIIGSQFTVIAPDCFGAGSNGHWTGERPFRLADEAALTVDIIDACDAPVHLVGHSYGGAVALRAAITRSNRVASLSLYEPTAFHILRSMGPDGREMLQEVRDLATEIDRAVLTGNYRSAAQRFVDYWNGPGAWSAMRPERQVEIVRYLPKACLEFRALIDDPTPLVAYCRVRAPLLLMQGQHAPEPTQLITRKLIDLMRPASAVTISGAGHMGPLSHGEAIAETICDHIRTVEPFAGTTHGRRDTMRYAA